MGGWLSWLQILTLALVYLGAAKIPMASSLTFQAYLFWPAAAVAYTAFFILGQRALWGIAVGSLLLNGTAWLPWPQALVMTLLQTAGPLVAWRIMVRLGSPHPDLRHTKDLLRWLGVATLSSALFSSAMGSIVVGSALPGGVFTHAFATSFSWFLGDLAAILCLGPMLLHVFPGLLEASRGTDSGHPNPSFFSMVLVGSLCLLLLFGGQISPGLSPDFRLSIQFALVLPVLWMALRFGPRYTSIGVSLLSLAFLLHLNTGRLPLSDEAFRFSQLHLLVLAFAALVTASVAEEARMAHLALEARELQALRMEAVGTLAGGLVHEFNNQLTVVFGNLDRLQTVLPDGGQASPVVQRLAEAVDSIGSTVKHLKALSHHAPLQMSPLSLREALVPFLLRVPELSGQVTFHLEIEDGLLVRLDPDLLSQALQHLLTNSLEAIPGRGHIQLKAWQQDAWIHLIFEDNGVGMSPEVLRKACDPFFTTKPTAKGRGLGLSFAFSLAKQMGGRLSLESQPGKGTRVELVFPLGRPAPHPAPTRERLSRAQRILLADDEAGIRELTREFLEGEGFQVLAVADGQEALDAFHSDPRAWDLLILDLVMPKLGGAEVLSRIEQIRPDLPALMISGYSAEVRPDLLDGSHRGFLAKPFRLHELLKAIQLLELKSPLRGAPLG
jgi:signal transduction histidine kinase